MDSYITGLMIKQQRRKKNITQLELAQKLNVSDKTVSKWETGRGYPDNTQLEPLAKALGISVIELMSGKLINNTNRSSNMTKLKLYVCPVCQNVIVSIGESLINCCGKELNILQDNKPNKEHSIGLEKVENQYYVSIDHPMTKGHFISFIAAVQDNGYELVKLFPEGPAEAYFSIRRTKVIYFYCSEHGLFKYPIQKS